MTMGDLISTLASGFGSAGLPVVLIVVKATLVLLAALVVTRLMEKEPAVARHLVWFVSLGAVLLIPVLSSWSPLRLAILPAPVSAESHGAPPDQVVHLASETAPAVTTDQRVEAVGAGFEVPEVNVAPVAAGSRLPDAPVLLAAIWGAVALLFAGWLALGALSVRRIISRARTLDSHDWTNPLWEIADRLGLDQAPRLLQSADAKMPFACGLFRPTIVLPADSDSWTLERRRAVLLHELAHVRRRDLVGHAIGRFACALYWFHPLVWTAAKRLRSESERACDDLALNCGARASDYAEHLLDIVTGVRHHATPAVALAMARRKEFEGRMLAILDPELRRTSPGRAKIVALAGGLTAFSLAVGAAVPVARAATGLPLAEPGTIASVDSGIGSSSEAIPGGDRSQPVFAIDSSSPVVERTPDSMPPGQAPAASGQLALDAESLLATLQGGSPGQRSSDERPALLARILRTDSSASIRRIAAWGLAEYGNSDVGIDALAQALRQDPDVSVREMAAWALADARSTSAVTEALSSALRRDSSPKVRATAAWSLGSIGHSDALGALTAALRDSSSEVQMRAIWALGNVGVNKAPPQLIALLSNSDREVKRMVAWALYNIEDPAAVPALTAAMRAETDKPTQLAFIRALTAAGEHSIEAIKALLDSPDPQVREAAIRALAGGNASGPWPQPWPQPRPRP
jgi:beta-lactamase regulating signal transducer with metallopeptidase domain/HEAT repeat protein